MAKLGVCANNITEKNPVLFLKPTTSYVQEGTPIMLPPPSVGCIHYETELGLVIGQHCKHVSEADALDVLSGYCLVRVGGAALRFVATPYAPPALLNC